MKKVKFKLSHYLNRMKSAPKAVKIIILLIIPLTILTYFLNMESIFVRPYEVERGSYGREKTPYKVNLSVGEFNNMEFDFSVSSRRYTEEEADLLFDKLYEESLLNLLGDNEDYYHIKKNLNFKSGLGNGVTMTLKFRPEMISSPSEYNIDYFTKYQNIIDSAGRVHNEDLSSDEVVEGYLILRFSVNVSEKETAYKSKEYYIDVNVIKADTSKIEELKKDIKNKIKEIDKDTLDKDTITLPREISGNKIVYKNKTNYNFLLVPILLITVCAILMIKVKVDKKEEDKKLKEQLKIDYPQIITKILIYVSSGLTIRNSIRLIASTYEKNKSKNKNKLKRRAYEELQIAKKKLDSGMGEIKVYEEMASSIKDRTYTRFLNIIIQNIKNGNKDIKNILSLEVQDALYERKQRAKKLGEEASTKLILPLMLMLFVIMIIIMVPAFMGMK